MPELLIDPTLRRIRRLRLALLVVAYSVFAVVSPKVVMLADDGPASWLRPPLPLVAELEQAGEIHNAYRAGIRVPAGFKGADLQVTALRRVTVQLDRAALPCVSAASDDWKRPRVFRLPPGLSPGVHGLTVDVSNTYGPALVRVQCPALGFYSGAAWQVKVYDDWVPVALAHDPEGANLPEMVSPSPANVLSGIGAPVGLMLVLTAVVFSAWRRRIPRAGVLRIGMIAAWLVLAVLDMTTVPVGFGFDASEHFHYLDFIVDHHRLPVGTDGWQMFQSPLFYIVGTPLWAMLKTHFSHDASGVLIRVIPMICGGVMIELVYRTLRLVFPDRNDLQCVGLVVTGFLPVNLYMMQFASNEPCMAVFAAATVWSVCRWLAKPNLQRPWRPAALTGLLLGLAILSKVSAVIWAAPVALAYIGPMLAEAKPWPRIAKSLGAIAGVVAVVAGWWFLRNQIEMGVPFLSHSAGNWWQDPGYRIPSDLYRFGFAMIRPTGFGAHSVWDSLYGSFWGDANCSGVICLTFPPPWNVRLMQFTLWFGLLPTALMLLAAAVALFGMRFGSEPKQAAMFAAVAIAFFVAAVLHVYLTLPIYSCAKASYMMGATPCFAILVAAGYDRVPKSLRSTVAACLVTGAGLGYATFFVLSYSI